MSEYMATWGGTHQRPIAGPEELAALLDELWDQRGDGDAPYNLVVSHEAAKDPEAEMPPYIQGAIGHPSGLGVVVRYGRDYGTAWEPDVPPPNPPDDQWDLAWDVNGQITAIPHYRIRLRGETVRVLLLAFMSGEEVTRVRWNLKRPGDEG